MFLAVSRRSTRTVPNALLGGRRGRRFHKRPLFVASPKQWNVIPKYGSAARPRRTSGLPDVPCGVAPLHAYSAKRTAWRTPRTPVSQTTVACGVPQAVARHSKIRAAPPDPDGHLV